MHGQQTTKQAPKRAPEQVVVYLDERDRALEREAVTRWLARFADQEFSLTDAVSFEVMQRNKVTHAFAFDRHFAIAGFKLLT
jgi:predicted nucleic acid-binding protein